MDPKKQQLNPELKEIYDRVMNTQVKTNPSTQPQVSTPPAGQMAPSTAVSSNAREPGLPPLAGAGLQTVPGGAGGQSAPQTSPAATLGGIASPNPVAAPAAPAPAGGGQSAPSSFVFTGDKVTTPLSGTQSHGGQTKKVPGSVIMVLVAILIIVWGFFWAKFFGLL